LGCLFYWLMTGMYLFLNKDEPCSNPTMHQPIDLTEAKLNRKLSACCKDLLQRMLEINVVKRATLKEVLAHRWFY